MQFTLPLTGSVDFDLGGPQAIDRVLLWNLSLQNIRLQIADAPGGPFTEVGSYVLPNRLSFLSYSPERLSLGGTFSASYLRIAIDSAYTFAPTDTFTYAIVGEVAVSATPVPEPESWLMWAAGVPALALLGRQRARRIRRS